MIAAVGEQNPYTSGDSGSSDFALYPHPRGATGDRLRVLCGLEDNAYLRSFRRANLLDGELWHQFPKEAADGAVR